MEKRVTPHIAKDWLFKLGYIALWYFFIFIIVNVVVELVSWLNLPNFKGSELLEISSASSYIFMLVLGIVMPLIYHKYYIALGVTRRQMTQGMLLGVLGLSLFIALVNIALYLAAPLLNQSVFSAQQIPAQFVRDLVLLTFFYLIGWLIALGFSYGRFITAAPSIVVGVIALNGVAWLFGDSLVLVGPETLLPEIMNLCVVLVAAVILAVVLRTLLRRMPVKAN